MSPLLNNGQVLKGYQSTYTVIKELHRALDEAAVYLARYNIFASLRYPFQGPCEL